MQEVIDNDLVEDRIVPNNGCSCNASSGKGGIAAVATIALLLLWARRSQRRQRNFNLRR